MPVPPTHLRAYTMTVETHPKRSAERSNRSNQPTDLSGLVSADLQSDETLREQAVARAADEKSARTINAICDIRQTHLNPREWDR